MPLRRVPLASTRIGKYYRTTVPGEVRKLLGLSQGDSIVWILDGDKIVIEKGERNGEKERQSR